MIQETGQKTAVKVVSKKKLSDEDYHSLLMEIEILSQLDHPHIIRYAVAHHSFMYPSFCTECWYVMTGVKPSSA